MSGAYTPNGYGSSSRGTSSWPSADQDRSSSAPPGAFSPQNGRGRRGRRGNGNGNGHVARRRNGNGNAQPGSSRRGLAPPPPQAFADSDDGMSAGEGEQDGAEDGDGMQKELALRRRRQEELRIKMAEYQAKRREEMEGREAREAEELQRKIQQEEADPVLRRRREEAIAEHKEWERALLAMPIGQAWIEVKDTQDERVARWQDLKLMGGVEYRPTRGLCEGMCSASEIVERIATMDVMFTERDYNTGEPDPVRFVKRYKRVEPVIIPTDVRTAPALRKTTTYLLDALLNRDNYGVIYGFVEDRCRAIMKDFSVQRISDPPAMFIHERIARFYAFSVWTMYESYRPIQSKPEEGAKLAVPAQGYNPTLNKQQLDKGLLTLKNMYTDNHVVQGPDRRRNPTADLFPCEAEMAAYRLISDYVEYRMDFRKYSVAKRDWEKAQAASATGAIDYSTMPRDPGPPQLRWDYAVRMTPWMFLASDLIECAKGSESAPPPPTTPCRYTKISAEVRFFDLLMLPTAPPLFAALFMEELGWVRVQAMHKLLGGKPGYVRASTLAELLKFDSENEVGELAKACGLTVVAGPDEVVRVGWRNGDELNFVDPVLPRQASHRVFEGKFGEEVETSDITMNNLPHFQSFDGYPQLDMQPYYEVVKTLLDSGMTSGAAGFGQGFAGHRGILDGSAFGQAGAVGDGRSEQGYGEEGIGETEEYEMDGEEGENGEDEVDGEEGEGVGDLEEEEDYAEEEGDGAEEDQDQPQEAPAPPGQVPSLLARLGAKASTPTTTSAANMLNPAAQPFVPGAFGLSKPTFTTQPTQGDLFSTLTGTSTGQPTQAPTPTFGGTFMSKPPTTFGQPTSNPLPQTFPAATSSTAAATPATGNDAPNRQALFSATFGSLFRPTAPSQNAPVAPASHQLPPTPPEPAPPPASFFAPKEPSTFAPAQLAFATFTQPSTSTSATQSASAFTQPPTFPTFAPVPTAASSSQAPQNISKPFQPIQPPSGSVPLVPQAPLTFTINSTAAASAPSQPPSSAEPTPPTVLPTNGSVSATKSFSGFSWTMASKELEEVQPKTPATIIPDTVPTVAAFPTDIRVSVPEPPTITLSAPTPAEDVKMRVPSPTTVKSPAATKQSPVTVESPAIVQESPMQVDLAPQSPTHSLSLSPAIESVEGTEDAEADHRRSRRRTSIDEALLIGLGNPSQNSGFGASRSKRLPKFNDWEEAQKRRKEVESARRFHAPNVMHDLLLQILETMREEAERLDPIRGFQTWIVPSQAGSKHANWLASKFSAHQAGTTKAGRPLMKGFVDRASEGLVPPSPGLIVFECSPNIMPDNFSVSACRSDKERLMDVLSTIPDIQSYLASVLVIVHGDFFPGSAAYIHKNLGLDSLPPVVQDARVITLSSENRWVTEIEESLSALKLDALGRSLDETPPYECLYHLVKEWRERLWEALPEVPGTEIIGPVFRAFIAGVDHASNQIWKLSTQAGTPCPLELPSFEATSTPTWKKTIDAVNEYLRQPSFAHSTSIAKAREFLRNFAATVSRATVTYGIELYPIFEHIGNHVLELIEGAAVHITFRDEFLGRDLLNGLDKAVRSGWASTIADFNIACQDLPQPSQPETPKKRTREEEESPILELKTYTPKRARMELDTTPPVNGTTTPILRDSSTPPKRGTLQALRARIKAANALAAGEFNHVV